MSKKKSNPVKKTEKTTPTKNDVVSISAALAVTMHSAQRYDKQLIIVTADDYERAREHYKLIRAMDREVELKQRAILDPLKVAMNEVKTLFSPARTLLARVSDVYEVEMTKYANKQAILRQNELKRIDSDKRLTNIETIQTKREQVVERPSGTMIVKKLHIIDEKKIPNKFWIIDEQALKMALKSGEKIPGAELIDELTIVNR